MNGLYLCATLSRIFAILATIGAVMAAVFGLIRTGKTQERTRQVAENQTAAAEVAEVRADINEEPEHAIRTKAKSHFIRPPTGG